MAAGRIRKVVSAVELALGAASIVVAAISYVRIELLDLDRCPPGIHDCIPLLLPFVLFFCAAVWLIPSGLILRQSDYVALFGHAIWFCILCALFE